MSNPLYKLLSLLVTIIRFVANRSGQASGVGRLQKLGMAMRILRNHFRVRSLSTLPQQFLLAEEILRLPSETPGDVVECGCYNGASTITLSIACARTHRRLFVCDSFSGLPRPEPSEELEIHGHSKNYYLWEEGEFASQGGLEGVRKNVETCGEIEACCFVPGFFKDTLPHLETDSVALVFEDADLVSSVKDCLLHLWPKLREGSRFYCHEPWSVQVVRLFYDQAWWQENLRCSPPGFYGSGRGTMLDGRYTAIGFAEKFDPDKVKKLGVKTVLPGSRGFPESQKTAG